MNDDQPSQVGHVTSPLPPLPAGENLPPLEINPAEVNPVRVGYSPVPVPEPELEQTTDLMTFAEAVQKMLTGSNITRVEWKDEKVFGYIDVKTEQMMIVNKGLHNWGLVKADILAEDWVVV